MQTLMLVLADTGVSASMGQRPGDACGGAPGDHRRLILAGLAGYGG
jgi:hypothetical protein